MTFSLDPRTLHPFCTRARAHGVVVVRFAASAVIGLVGLFSRARAGLVADIFWSGNAVKAAVSRSFHTGVPRCTPA